MLNVCEKDSENILQRLVACSCVNFAAIKALIVPLLSIMAPPAVQGVTASFHLQAPHIHGFFQAVHALKGALITG